MESVLRLGCSKCQFLALENGNFFLNRIFSVVFEAFYPLYEAKISNRSLFIVYGSMMLKTFWGALETSPDSPKWSSRHLGYAVPFSGEYQANF